MFIVKNMEVYNINQVIIKYNEDIKSFEFNIEKDDHSYYFKYKVKRRDRKNTSERKNKRIKSNDNLNIRSKLKSAINKIIAINKFKKLLENKKENNNNKCNINQKDVIIEIQNESDDLSENNKNINTEFLLSSSIELKNEIIQNVSELLKLMKYSNDLLIDVYKVIMNTPPKKALKKINNLTRNFENVVLIPKKASSINDRLIQLTNLM
jgi:hypothetical protein